MPALFLLLWVHGVEFKYSLFSIVIEDKLPSRETEAIHARIFHQTKEMLSLYILRYPMNNYCCDLMIPTLL